MSEIIGLIAAYTIFGAFAVAGGIALLWLAWQMLSDGVNAELSPFCHFVRLLPRRER